MANSNSMLKNHLGEIIAVTAVYVNVVKNYKGEAFAVLSVIRSIGGDLFRDHMWCPEIKVFLDQPGIQTGSIVQLEGTVSTYEKNKGMTKILDYTMTDIHNLKIIGDSHSQANCELCNYKRRVTDLKDELDFHKDIVDRKEKDEKKASDEISWLQKNIKILEKDCRASKRNAKALSKEKNALRNTLEQIYKISQRKTVKNAERMKKRIRALIEDEITAN